jgi:hypothetical protein
VILKSRGRTVPCRIEADALMAGSFAGRASIRPRVRIGFGKSAPSSLPSGRPLSAEATMTGNAVRPR